MKTQEHQIQIDECQMRLSFTLGKKFDLLTIVPITHSNN